MADHTERVIFLHIPKTAGTTLTSICHKQYDGQEYHHLEHQPEVYNLSVERKSQIRFLQGSYWYGIHEEFAPPNTYVTLLRDPVKRIISLYNYTRQRKDHNMHVVTKKYTITELYEKKLHKEALDNGQTRRISGVWDQVPYGMVTEEIFALAQKNLRDRFQVVGTMERFDETLVLLKLKLNWENIYYEKYNTSKKNGGEKAVFSKQERALILEHNQWDQKLHQYANALLDEAIAQNRLVYYRAWGMFKLRRFYWGVLRKISVRTMIKEFLQSRR